MIYLKIKKRYLGFTAPSNIQPNSTPVELSLLL
jgi:hypothetical protein